MDGWRHYTVIPDDGCGTILNIFKELCFEKICQRPLYLAFENQHIEKNEFVNLKACENLISSRHLKLTFSWRGSIDL